jgi:hypothetical protein
MMEIGTMQLGKRNRDRLATVRSHCKTIAWLTEFAEDPERSEDSFKSELDDAINRLDSLVDLRAELPGGGDSQEGAESQVALGPMLEMRRFVQPGVVRFLPQMLPSKGEKQGLTTVKFY